LLVRLNNGVTVVLKVKGFEDQQTKKKHPAANRRNNDRLMNPARTDGSISRGYGSKMGKYICCESWWMKMRSRL